MRIDREKIYQKVLKKHWNSGDMNSLATLGDFGREIINETIEEIKKETSQKNRMAEKIKMEQKTYTEKEIFEIIDKFGEKKDKNLLVYCQGRDLIPVRETTETSSLTKDLEELKKEFMTPQGFRKAIEDSGLVGKKFT